MTATNDRFQSVYSEVWDVVVFGGGYVGYALATQLHAQGKRTLLVDRAATLLWESAWAFSGDVGNSSAAAWKAFHSGMAHRNAAGDRWIDGAIAQVVASHEIREAKLPTLFYATPVASRSDDSGAITSVTVVAKSDLRVLTARQWVDATEAGELLAVLPGQNWESPEADRETIRLFYRHKAWVGCDKPVTLKSKALPFSALTFAPSPWENERILSYDLPAPFAQPKSTWVPAIIAVQKQLPDAIRGAVITHTSLIPMPVYLTQETQNVVAPNVVNAVPASVDAARANTLAGRFEIGVGSIDRLAAASVARVSDVQATVDTPQFAETMQADVVVAGVGTGGAMAAIAAAREGATTLAFDPLPFAGGIGTGGGIHSYYYGVKGGLQDELDERTREIMPLFGSIQQVSGFHPDAKKIVLEQMLDEAGVTLLTAATLFGTTVDAHGTITSAQISTERGAVKINANAWIDGTGDADLAAAAGAQFNMGRVHDGQLHAFSQSSGRANVQNDRARMLVINYDAGFVDPTDAQDLTRGRLLSTAHYLQEQYDSIERPTYIAPALGLRQGRQVVTDYVVTLADLIEKRHFDDSIGLTGCHYDNHAIDYEFETDEAMFWVWCCRQWRGGRTGGQMPYRMMLPVGISNLWVACRGAGISEEAHHSLRMQRDFQRLGEVAGIAAALTTVDGGPGHSRKVSMPDLRKKLIETGALADSGAGDADPFGHSTGATDCQALEGDLSKWFTEVSAGPGTGMYRLMRHGHNSASMRKALHELLGSTDAKASFRAASILALWEDSAAEPRLVQTITSREYGFETTDELRPESSNRLAPHWIVATRLLRTCGTPECLNDLATLASDSSLLHNARTSMAITVAAIAARHKLSPEQKALVTEILRKLLDSPLPNAVGDPQRKVIESKPASATPATPQSRQVVIEDFSWQLHLAVAKAEQTIGIKVHDGAAIFLSDPRATVRKSFSQVLQSY